MGRLRVHTAALAMAALALGACTGGGPRSEDAAPAESEGPPEVRAEVVDEHARQFDEELTEREAGTQQEFAAATYITAHLQRAGYDVALRSVPFKDLVRSTNVVALPPAGGDPEAVVTVPYDTTSSSPEMGHDIGMFLELARAAKAADPDHGIQFVALAAELTGSDGGNLGSRALVSELEELDEPPLVVSLVHVSDGGFKAPGAAGDRLNEIALSLDIEPSRPLSEPVLPVHLRASNFFIEAGISHAIAAGGVEEVGRVMMEFLADPAR